MPLRKVAVDLLFIGAESTVYGTEALDACIAPLREIKDLILKNPEASDEEIAEIYNSLGNPVIGAHVVVGVRKAQCSL